MVLSARSPKLTALFESGRETFWRRGERVSSTDDEAGISLVVSGYVKRSKISNDGNLSTQIIYGPHDIFSLTRMYRLLLHQSIYDGPEVYHYWALDNVTLHSLSSQQCLQAVKSDPLLYRELFAEAGRHLKACVHSLENASLDTSVARVAHQILFFANEFGTSIPGGIRLEVPLTHQDIAEVLGTTRETVSRAMGKLKADGLVSGNRYLEVLDAERLRALAYS